MCDSGLRPQVRRGGALTHLHRLLTNSVCLHVDHLVGEDIQQGNIIVNVRKGIKILLDSPPHPFNNPAISDPPVIPEATRKLWKLQQTSI